MSKSKTIIPDELLDTFRIASERVVEIKLPDAKAASTLRFRFHHARKKMRIDEHPLLEKAERVVFQIKENVLIAAPYTAKYGTALEDALAPFRDAITEEKMQEEKALIKSIVDAKIGLAAEKLGRKEEEDSWLRGEAERLAKKADTRKPETRSIKQLLGGKK